MTTDPKTLARHLAVQSFGPMRDWPGGVADFNAVATGAQVAAKNQLVARVKAAHPDRDMPEIKVLRTMPDWRKMLTTLASDATPDRTTAGAATYLIMNMVAAADWRTNTLYVSELLVKKLSPQELAGVLGHEMGHIFVEDSAHIVRHVYGDALSMDERMRRQQLIGECQADRFTPRELRPALASALQKIIHTVDPQMWKLRQDLLKKMPDYVPQHPMTPLRVKELLADKSPNDLAATQRLFFNTECKIVPPPPTPPVPESGVQQRHP